MTLEKMLNFSVPETSYSSSEGEEDFYDANDDPFSSQVTTPTRWVPKAFWSVCFIDFHVDFGKEKCKSLIIYV